MTGLYIHVPFCAKKCVYCDFYSIPYDKSGAKSYTAAVIRNIAGYNADYDTVYFGGGTPSLLWCEIRDICGFLQIHNAEITVEANPSDITGEMLNALLKSGVNRLSVGVQSLCDRELAFLTRRHNAETALNAVKLAKSAGFENISADIMLGIPGQTERTLENTIDALSFVNHISAYQLTVHDNRIQAADDDLTAELYLKTVALLKERGFEQYEISNFAKPGFACRHNLKYWRSEEYIGIGPSAHSFYSNRRYAVPKDINSFINSPLQEIYITEPEPGGFSEWAMLRLRLTEGVTFAECEARGVSREVLLRRAEKIPGRYIRKNNEKISLTTEGFLISNKILAEIL